MLSIENLKIMIKQRPLNYAMAFTIKMHPHFKRRSKVKAMCICKHMECDINTVVSGFQISTIVLIL